MDEFEQGIDRAQKKFESFSDNLQKAGEKMSSVGGTLTTGVTLPIVGFGTAAGKMSMDFENAMAKVGTIADASVVPLEVLESAIIGLSNETGVASSSIAESVYNVISATGDTAGAVDLVRNATKLATAGFTDSESAMSVLTTAMNAYGISAGEATKISDSLIMTQNLGVTTVADLASNMGRAIATASAYGVGLENLEAGYVALTKSGISTAEGTTYLSSMFNELGKSGGDVSKILQEQTGMSFGQLMEGGYSLADVLGVLYESTGRNSEGFINLWSSAEAGKAANAIVNQGLQEFNTNLETISGSMGATQSAYETMQTNSFNLNKVINELKNAVTGLGDVLVPVIVPALTAVVEKVTAAVEWFNNLDKGAQNLILTIGGIAVAAGPVLTVIGNVITAVGKIGGAINTVIGIGSKLMGGIKLLFALIAANPVVAIITGIIAAVILLYTKCEWFRDAVHAVIDAVAGFFQWAWDLIVSAWEAAGDFFGGIVDGIKGVFDGIGEFLGGLFTAAWEMVQGAWDAAVEFFSGIGNGIRETFQAVTETVSGFFRSAWEAVQGAWSAAKGFFSGIWDAIKSGAKTAADNAGSAFKKGWEAVKSAWDGATTFFSGIWDKIKGVFSDVWSKFKEIGGNIVSGIKDGILGAWDSFIGWIGDKVGGIVTAVKNMLGIHSPSRVFAGIGENMALGLAEGWNDEYSDIKRQITNGLNFGTATVGITASSSYNAPGMAQNGLQAGFGGGGNTYVTINSPVAVDAVTAAREWKKTTQRMAMGYV